ncbi:norbelladine synthase [Eucalyptus grandis]|uniref:Bet v I/Major latex protein domain-containing protein n=2 Tax=Eucalyptus grandis TaxID=71139 RepID=A0A059DJC7_EUCGR|nr:norbelladine synthase [Eucalyptus grandis]KAK3447469.1 hypothetical protein EUGRSUZ_A02983 [Eucalyptus grandis]
MSGQVSYETEVKAGAAKVWGLYGTTKMALLAKEALPDTIIGLDILEGQGAVGTIIKITLAGGFSYKEKFTKVDHENRVKETEAIEGGFLNMGLSLYRLRLEVIGKDEESCMIKSTIEYEITNGASFDVSLVSVKLFADIAEVVKKQLTISASAN